MRNQHWEMMVMWPRSMVATTILRMTSGTCDAWESDKS